jgi:hypothetical protein
VPIGTGTGPVSSVVSSASAASGSAAIPVIASGSAHAAPVTGAVFEGANTYEAALVKPNGTGDTVHRISTSGSPADGAGGAPVQ